MNEIMGRELNHRRILIVDDEDIIRDILQEAFSHAGYSCSVAKDAKKALEILDKNRIDVVITDIKMPGMDGIELLGIIKEKYDSDVIVMTGYVEEITYENVIEKGASDFIQKPIKINESILRLNRVLSHREVLSEKEGAVNELQNTLTVLRKAMGGFVKILASTVEARDPYTAGHQRRVSDLARAIANEMGLSKDKKDGIRMAGVIHDLGKIAIPSEILAKPSRLKDVEVALIKTHPQVGYDLLKTIDFPWPIEQIVLQHHERINGSGYPNGLRDKDIMVEAKVVGVADVVEAMASHRPYRPALGIDTALDEISKNRKVLYAPEVVDACLRLFKEKKFEFK